ncbi:IS3 family transposase [Gimesia aquarii]|uniref:IS2 transposase TnpB n=1 Tax=Gimesia aquarii TaxID=2527964 RepID=A0A517VXN7_9PLAN|nr:IS3 family transposase [Gimesia aquarii]QDT97761.1 IS2 transposase TnpB [Gimesia aquarii]
MRDADATLNAGQNMAAVLQALEFSESTFERWRNQYGGMKSEEAKRRPRFGYPRIGCLLRQKGWQVSDTRIFRLWRREGLKVPQKKRKRKRSGTSVNGCLYRHSEYKDHVWCWDFIFDRTTNGSPLKCLLIIDEYTRECLALKMDRSIKSEDAIDTLAELFAMRGVPKCIRSDNGPEFVSKAIQRWLQQLKIEALYMEPGSPWQNGYIESFNSRFRDEFLAMEEFECLSSARKLTNQFRDDYNQIRPHSSLGYVAPAEFASRCAVVVRAQPDCKLHSEIT